MNAKCWLGFHKWEPVFITVKVGGKDYHLPGGRECDRCGKYDGSVLASALGAAPPSDWRKLSGPARS